MGDIEQQTAWGFETAAVHAGQAPDPVTGAVVTTNANPTALTTPHGDVTPTAGAGAGTTVTYSYSQGTENNTLDTAENFGFRLTSGVLEYQNGGSTNWLPISDSNSVTITSFAVTPSAYRVPDSCIRSAA